MNIGILYQNYNFEPDTANPAFSGFLTIEGVRHMVTMGYPNDPTLMILRHDGHSDFFVTANFSLDPELVGNEKGSGRYSVIVQFLGQDYRIRLHRARTIYQEPCVSIRAEKLKKIPGK